MPRVAYVGCVRAPHSEALLAFAGLLAALGRWLENSQEMAQRNRMLQVQKLRGLGIFIGKHDGHPKGASGGPRWGTYGSRGPWLCSKCRGMEKMELTVSVSVSVSLTWQGRRVCVSLELFISGCIQDADFLPCCHRASFNTPVPAGSP